MADPTNIAVPPAKAADPTNISVPVHGTKFPSGVTGADQVITLSQGSDLSTGLTDDVVAAWVAPFDCYVRQLSHMAMAVTATATFDLVNTTASTTILGDTAPTADDAVQVTSFTTQGISAGDEIRLRVTTDGSGALKGLQVILFVTPLSGSTLNPV